MVSIISDNARSVLVVSDDPSMKVLLPAWIESVECLPYDIDVATVNGTFEALELLALRRFDVVLVCADVDGNGAEIIRDVKSHPCAGRAPCILGSVSELSRLVRDAEACGADYLLSYVDHTVDDLALFLWDAFQTHRSKGPETEHEPQALAEFRPPGWSPAWNGTFL